MKFKAFFIASLLLVSVLSSCGSSLDKGSIEGRVAGIADNDTNIFAIFSIDLDNIIQKSGIFDGALPEQYVSTIMPFKSALYESVNTDKPVFGMIAGPLQRNEDPDKILLMFEIKDVTKLKNEFKELDITFKGDDKFSFASRDEMSIGLIENKIALMIVNLSDKNLNEEDFKKYVKMSAEKVKNEKLIEAVLTQGDLTAVLLMERISGATNMEKGAPGAYGKNFKNTTKDSYMIAKMNFNEGQADIEMNYHFGENMQEYLPMFSKSVSQEAINSIGSGSPIFAIAMNFDFKKLIDNIYVNLEPNDQAEVNQALAMAGGKDKIKEMFTGEFAFAMYESNNASKDPNMNGYIGLNDASYLKTLITGFGPMAGMTTEADGSYKFRDDVQLKLDDKKLVYSTNVSSFSKLVNGTKGKLEVPSGFTFGNKAISMFLDFSKLDPKDFPADSRMFIDAFSYMFVEGDDNGIKAVLKAKSGKKNILRQLVELGIESMNTQIEYNDDVFDDMTDEEWEAYYNQY